MLTISNICCDKAFELIHPKFPLFLALLEILYLIAIASNPSLSIRESRFDITSLSVSLSFVANSISERLNSTMLDWFFINFSKSLLIIPSSN